MALLKSATVNQVRNIFCKKAKHLNIFCKKAKRLECCGRILGAKTKPEYNTKFYSIEL